MTEQDKIAAFIASRGVTRVAAGESTLNYDRRDWRAAVRGGRPRHAIKTDDELIQERHVRTVNGKDWITNGLGELIAHE